jgi:hypothetical protein
MSPYTHTPYDHTDGVWHIRLKSYIIVYRGVNTPPETGCFEVQCLKQLTILLVCQLREFCGEKREL